MIIEVYGKCLCSAEPWQLRKEMPGPLVACRCGSDRIKDGVLEAGVSSLPCTIIQISHSLLLEADALHIV
jgi:hypothetical protein